MGDVIGGFKAAVTREIRRFSRESDPAIPPPSIRFWHRNYYETIVCTPEAARRIAEYIRANPWKLVQQGTHEGRSYLEMVNRDGNLTAAEERNRFVLDCAEKRWMPYVSPGGMLERLIRILPRQGLQCRTTSEPNVGRRGR